MDISWLIYTLLLVIPLVVAFLIATTLNVVGTRRWAWIAGATTPYLLFTVPLAGVYLSLNLLSSLAAVKGLFTRTLWRLWWFRFALVLVCWPLVAMAWSPSPFAGFRDFIYQIPFLFLCGAMFAYADDGLAARRLLALVLKLTILQALLVMVFRLAPTLEAQFITSPLAQFFISPNVIAALFSGEPNNIFDANKAGGLFVNANGAAAFMGCCAMLAWFMRGDGRGEERSTWMTTVGALNWSAVFFTGSKAGAICAVMIPALVLAARMIRLRRIGLGTAAAVCILLAAAIAAAPFVWTLYQGTGFTRASTETLSVRQQIWTFALRMIRQHPLIGLGHGGWEQAFPFYAIGQGLNPNYPPHNSFLILWSKSGLVAVLAGIGFSAALLTWCLRIWWRSTGALNSLAIGVAAAFTWIFIQAQGENFGLIGEPHMTSMLALAIGILARESTRNSGRPPL